MEGRLKDVLQDSVEVKGKKDVEGEGEGRVKDM